MSGAAARTKFSKINKNGKIKDTRKRWYQEYKQKAKYRMPRNKWKVNTQKASSKIQNNKITV